MANNSVTGQRTLFYLHGKIIEDQGANAFDTVNGFGAYEYEHILDAFRIANFKVMSEVRQRDTDASAYAHKIAGQVTSLLKAAVKPESICIVGASKGAIIAMLVSSLLKNQDINFVFIAGCMKGLSIEFPDIQFCGNILSIYESSDVIAQTCMEFKDNTKLMVPHYKEIILHTGLRHGFLYKPLAEWVEPAISWANDDYR